MKKIIFLSLLVSTNAFAGTLSLLPGLKMDFVSGQDLAEYQIDFPISDAFSCRGTMEDYKFIQVQNGLLAAELKFPLRKLDVTNSSDAKKSCIAWYNEEKTQCRLIEVTYTYRTIVRFSVENAETILNAYCLTDEKNVPQRWDEASVWTALLNSNLRFIKFAN